MKSQTDQKLDDAEQKLCGAEKNFKEAMVKIKK
jgi:hypothetical protein